jgi:hypothetical protein
MGWNSIACSADGTKVVAVAVPEGPAVIYVSTNSGSSWTSTVAPKFQFFPRVASSVDGTKLVEASWDDELGVSTTSGKTWKWTQFATNNALYGCIASSSDGSKLAMANGYTSKNSGHTWEKQNYYWGYIAASADGTKLVATDYTPSLSWTGDWKSHRVTGPIYFSSSWGAGWEKTTAPVLAWNSIACSSNAIKLVAAADEGIYTSADSGNTWKYRDAPTNFTWLFVASSTDGTSLVAGANEGIALSADSGGSWSVSHAPNNMTKLSAIASSADGTRLYVTFDGGAIYAVQTLRNGIAPHLPSIRQ